MPRNWEFQSLHVSANRAVGLPSWKIMRRRAIWFTWKGFGCIRLLIQAVKMEIPVYLLFGGPTYNLTQVSEEEKT